MAELIYPEESYQIVGACMEVHNDLGPGFLEAVYAEALMLEFEERDIPYEINKEITIHYKGKPVSPDRDRPRMLYPLVNL